MTVSFHHFVVRLPHRATMFVHSVDHAWNFYQQGAVVWGYDHIDNVYTLYQSYRSFNN